MIARLYSRTSKTPKNPLRGQAERVYRDLSATPELATVVSERIAKSADPLKTRQDPYRVTLYYILVFKNQGLVQAHEPVVAEAVEQPESIDATDETVDDIETINENA